jgi:hypothetical protein
MTHFATLPLGKDIAFRIMGTPHCQSTWESLSGLATE